MSLHLVVTVVCVQRLSLRALVPRAILPRPSPAFLDRRPCSSFRVPRRDSLVPAGALEFRGILVEARGRINRHAGGTTTPGTDVDGGTVAGKEVPREAAHGRNHCLGRAAPQR